MKTASLAVLVGLGVLAPACIWDSDTLAVESKGKLDLVDAITGRFPRNPPLYYQMRLERVSKELAGNPTKLEDYDDAGVACDRLGRGPEAIGWMAKKRKVLDALPSGSAKDHWYRYYANLGTFLVHDWFRKGADRAKIAQVKEARADIAKAIEINPDAHFGREWAQLATMDWVIGEHKPGPWHYSGESLADWDWNGSMHGAKNPDAAKGLAGLVVLGNAWESPDVFDALGAFLNMRMESSVGLLAYLRCEELIRQGKKPLSQSLAERFAGDHPYWSQVTGNLVPYVKLSFKNLRAAADRYHEARTAFMMERLKAGRHPDTDPNFWDGFVEPPRGQMVNPPFLARWSTSEIAVTVIAACVGVLVLVFAFVLFRRARWRQA